ncbi:hypothetical protein JW992_01435 [candidate division KSB1 bacterium]|nr:hypothetical protein [candidate division KSB1 bacterium]
MGERELILLTAALVFFSSISLSVNRFFLDSSEMLLRNEFDYEAISLAQRFLEEAKTRRFDLYEPPHSFTSPYSLGWAYYESYPNFNDVDDFHNLVLDITTPRAVYRVSIQAHYVPEWNIDKIVYYCTNYKKVIITVTNPNLTQPIRLAHVYSYIDNT